MTAGDLYRKTVQGVSKLVTYPLLGNLSADVRSSIQEKAGKDWFNADTAAVVTMVANPFVYGVAAYVAFRYTGMDPMSAGVGASLAIAFPFGLGESLTRFEMAVGSDDVEFPGSVPGKVASLPLEVLMAD